jgi:hypothetical protein
MKLNKLTLVAAAGAMLATSAFAQKTVYMFGSTAYRKATFQAINAMVTSGSFTSLQYDDSTGTGTAIHLVTSPIASPSSAELGSTNLIWKGVLNQGGTNAIFGTNVTTIYCNWAGSVGGIKSLAVGADRLITVYLTDGNLTYGVYSSATNQVAMADCDQASTAFTSSDNPAYTELDPTLVSVLEFIWAKGNNGGTNIFNDMTNISQWSCQSLLSAGYIAQSQITGNSADNNQLVYLTGRNDDSGTRILCLADSAYGTQTAVNQYSCPNSGVYSYLAFGSGVDGNGDGYSSGGSVKSALIASRPLSYQPPGPPAGQEGILVGYIAVTDACNTPALSAPAGQNTLITVTNAAVPTGQWLTYNGVPWSEPAIIQGTYTYFGYEHLYVRPDATADTDTFASTLAVEQMGQAGAAVVPGTMPMSLMNIAVRGDGGIPAHN